MPTQSHRDFRTLVTNLKANNVTDQEMHDSLAAWMDKRGVPVRLAEEYRNEPAILALFAERGVRVMTAEQKAGLDAGTLTMRDILDSPAACPACKETHQPPFHYDTAVAEVS